MSWLYFFLAFLIFSSCTSTETPGKERIDTSHGDTTMGKSLTNYDNTYAIRLKTKTIALQQWDSTINFAEELGSPIKQDTRKLDQNSDTHAGAFIKKLSFEGIELQLYSPPQNGSDFWIMEMILTSGKYKTAAGIGLGDSFEKLKKAYPSIQKFPGSNSNIYFVADAGYEKSMEMEFKDDLLVKLRMYYMIP